MKNNYRRSLLKNLLFISVGLILKPFKAFAFKQKCYTGADIDGPYHRSGAPERNDLTLQYKGNVKGDGLIVFGKVYGSDCFTPISNAKLDIWQTDPAGVYDMSTKEFLFRAIIKTGRKGEYSFKTFIPGYYIDPGIGPRPRHIHFKISAPRHKFLVTQLYFEGDAKLDNDHFVKLNNGWSRALPYPKDQKGTHHINFDIFLESL